MLGVQANADAALLTGSPLLQVSSEARHAALQYYRVRLPFPRGGGGQVLYLNPEHDVLFVRPEVPSRWTGAQAPPRPTVVLIDFLHDVRAYDPRDKGYIRFSRFIFLSGLL